MKPKFLYNHTLPFNEGELAELLELARMAMSYQPVRTRLSNETGATDVQLSILQKKLVDYQAQVKR
jgi:hypothetical protein